MCLSVDIIVSGRIRLIPIWQFLAFRDRTAGSRNNREKPVEEAGKEPSNRGPRTARRDRQSRTGQTYVL
jgi:hypothetical protein